MQPNKTSTQPDTAHRAASTAARELASWLPHAGSADSDLIPELGTLVSRSRDLVRNHGVASGAIQTLTDNVVGTGLRLAAQPDYKSLGKDKAWADEWSRQVESQWRSWAETTDCDAARSLNFAGMTSQVFRSSMLNGEALALPLWLKGRSFSTVIQLVEPDRLSNPDGKQDGKRLRGGIEIDQYGAPKAYWIRKNHPGDVLISLGVEDDWQRIPIQTAFGRRRVLHIADFERSGQKRGKPLLTSVMPLFKMLDHYERSELQAAVVNAMIAAFIETPLDGEAIGEMFGGSVDDYIAARNEWKVRLQGGAIIPVFPGDKVSPFTPSRPNSGYGQFVENVLRHIGTGLNIPFELLMKDFSKTNYSSARAALMEAWRYFMGRRQWLATYWARPVYELWLEEAVSEGLVEAPGFYQNRAAWTRSKWIGPGRGWIDPVKEAEASRIRMENGLSTLEEECASQGLDWEEVLEQRAREQAKMRELGLSTPTMAAEDKQDNDDETMEQDDLEQSSR
ncbi:phage portal protein [Pseudemcibacter aquimaris]|uniref:phage portal protein n=1 Tax=Pseudemcibacter aquimaris TaxID=2857064 RepID=UPI00237E5FF2|nr:phage portal protein [Pseudemcibacter aquimaris]WDU57869.1 phage portal protein [Pseudemcibacter aquimaris]